MTTPAPTISIRELRDAVRGRVIVPDDTDYDAARTVVTGGIDRRPLAIVRVAGDDDVRRAISFARERDLELAVRSGGHSGAGHGVVEGGIVLDLRDMRGLDVDPVARTAWVETGLTAGEYTRAVAEHGLATGFGDTGSVGIGGITLGGGVGYLVRLHGLTIDSLLAADVVTADGTLHRVDADHEPDLFWAIRGGGGNFGVATRFELRLHPLERAVGGMLVLPATPGVVAGFIAAAEAAPEALSAIANVMPCPPLPFVPADRHGELVVFALMCFAGPADEAEAALAPFRALAAPVTDMLRPIGYPEMYPPDDPDYHPLAVARTLFMDDFGITDAERIVERLAASDAAMRVVQLRVLGGAVTRVAADATAYAHRDRRIMVNVASFHAGHDREVREAWVSDLVDILRRRPGAYVNFLAEDGAARIREAYPGPTWDRLVAIKSRYDPDNLFRGNHNIPPAHAR